MAVRSSSSLFFDRAFGLRPVRALKEPLPRFIIAGQKDEDVTFIFTDQDARSVLLGVPIRGVIDRPSLGGASVVGTPLELLVLLIFLSFLRTALTNPESCRDMTPVPVDTCEEPIDQPRCTCILVQFSPRM